MKKIILPLVIILIVGALVVLRIIQTHIPENDPSLVGNSGGNLINGGLFCENEGKIYFANPSDGGRLYVMDSDDFNNVERLSRDIAGSINVGGDYLYYSRRTEKRDDSSSSIFLFRTVGLYRMTTGGSRVKSLYNEVVGLMLLSGNDLLYQHYSDDKLTQCYRTTTDGKTSDLIYDDIIVPAAADSEWVYFAGTDGDHNIHRMRHDGTGDETIFEGNCADVILDHGTLYFLDLSNDTGVSSISKDGSNYTQIVDGMVSTFNIGDKGEHVYYQRDNSDHNGIYYCKVTGGEENRILSGDYNSIHTVKNGLFFRDFHTENYYYMKYDGVPKLFQPPKAE